MKAKLLINSTKSPPISYTKIIPLNIPGDVKGYATTASSIWH
jgi:hypothetical protein